jgi:hypothetical protein
MSWPPSLFLCSTRFVVVVVRGRTNRFVLPSPSTLAPTFVLALDVYSLMTAGLILSHSTLFQLCLAGQHAMPLLRSTRSGGGGGGIIRLFFIRPDLARTLSWSNNLTTRGPLCPAGQKHASAAMAQGHRYFSFAQLGSGIIDLFFFRPDLAPTFLFFNTTFARLAGLLQLCFIVWPASRAPSAARYSVSESNQGGERATRETEMISLSPARLPTCPPARPALFLSFSPGWCCFCLVCLHFFSLGVFSRLQGQTVVFFLVTANVTFYLLDSIRRRRTRSNNRLLIPPHFDLVVSVSNLSTLFTTLLPVATSPILHRQHVTPFFLSLVSVRRRNNQFVIPPPMTTLF